jgi:hypothetical protein
LANAREFAAAAGKSKTGNNRRLYNGGVAVVLRTAEAAKLLSHSLNSNLYIISHT